MMKINRRDAIGGILGTGAAIMATGSGAGASYQQPPPVFAGEHKPKPLPFDPSKLNGISEKLIRSHWENNYTGSVNALNAVEQRLARLLADDSTPAFVYGDLKREELLRTGSVVLHELYFENLGGDGRSGGSVRDAVKNSWGTFENWELEFRKTAASLSGGSGWTIFGYNIHTGMLHNYWLADHAHNPATGVPLLVLDMYEHSYQMDYGAAAAKYIDAFVRNIDWERVDKRLATATKSAD